MPSSGPPPGQGADVAGRALAEAAAGLESWRGLFELCADPTRLRLLIALHAAPEATVTDLAVGTGLTPNRVTQALRRLEGAGVAEPRRDGRHRRWRLTDPRLHTLLHHIDAPHTELHPDH